MVIKRYVVKDMPEAVVLIRKELGKDAVILSTKRIRMKKWLGLWRQNRIEVVAAIGDDVPVRSFDAPFLRTGTASPAAARQAKGNRPEEVVATSSDFEQASGRTEKWGRDVQGEDRLTANSDAGDLQKKAPAAEAAMVDLTALQQVREEIADLRRVLESSFRATKTPGSYEGALQDLARDGMSQDSRWDLSTQAEDNRFQPDLIGGDSEDAKTSAERDRQSSLVTQLMKAISVEPVAESSRLIMFVGPTGVGKTTTIAKLAALQVLSGKRKVGLITTDTFRIAAVEQLRTYANILNVPLEVVARNEDMGFALARLEDCDLIFIDTAGRNFEQQEHLDHVAGLLKLVPVDEVYLVLSLTTKEDDLNRLVRRFIELPIHKFIFTKLDETHSYGAIVNLLLTYQKPLSYLTTGQNVPNDIEIASLDKILQLVLSEVAV